MKDKVVLITGATDGIGKVAAGRLAEMGASVVLVGRDAAKSKRTVDAIRRESSNPRVEALVADLSSRAEVHRVAEEFTALHPKLDVLINNVGACFRERQESVDGIEMTWALNHLSYFLLTTLLDGSLRSAPEARVVTVSSSAHRGDIAFEDLEARENYHYWRAYRQSKLANLLFAYELARKYEDANITSNALHPGVVATSFFRNFIISKVKRALVGLVTISPEKGAQTSVYLASSPEVRGKTGLYFAKQKAVPSSKASCDEEDARRLWKISLAQCGLPSS